MGIFEFITATLAPAQYWADAAAEGAQDDARHLLEYEKSMAEIAVTQMEKRVQRAPANVASIMDILTDNTLQNPRNVSRETILAAYHTVPIFQATADLVAERIAEIDWFMTRDGVRVDHPIITLLENPNSLHDGYTYRWIQQHYFDLLGEEIAVRAGTIQNPALLPFPPTSTRRLKDGWEIRHNDFQRSVRDEDVISIIKPDLRDPYGRGSGIGLAVGDELEISKFAARHEKAEFANFSVPPFVAFVPGAGDKAADLAEMWRDEMVGADNHGRAMFISTPRDSSARPIIHEMSRKMADMGVAELRAFSDKLVRICWRIPPETLGDNENANRATSEHARDFLNENVLRPRLRWLQSGLEKELFAHFPDTEGLQLHFDDPRVENRAFTLEVIKEYPSAFTVNEVRAVSGLTMREGGDVYLRQGEAGQIVEVPAGDEIVDDGNTSDTDGWEDDKAAENVVYLFEDEEEPEPQLELTK